MSKVIRLGTRDSELALWQAKTVKSQLQALGYKVKLVPVKIGVRLVKESYQLICPVEDTADKTATPEQIKASVIAVIIGLSFTVTVTGVLKELTHPFTEIAA